MSLLPNTANFSFYVVALCPIDPRQNSRAGCRLGSCLQTMFSQQLHGTRLWSFFANFLGKGHASAHGQTGKRVVEHAVPVEVNLRAVTGLEESDSPEGSSRTTVPIGEPSWCFTCPCSSRAASRRANRPIGWVWDTGEPLLVADVDKL